MTKDDVKSICEADPQMQWWAMVLFAELCDYSAAKDNQAINDTELSSMVSKKVKEFSSISQRK